MRLKVAELLRDNQLCIMLLLTGGLYFCAMGMWNGREDPEEYLSEQYANILTNINVESVMKNSETIVEEEPDFSPAEGEQVIETVEQAEEILPRVAQWQEVDESYFDDALFIGDSRVVGLQDYGKLEEHATFYASTGLTIFKLLSAKIAVPEGQRIKVSVEEALGQRQFGKIYLMVGINEMGVGTVQRFAETYQQTITRISELQPDAIIYIQSILKVTKQRSEKGDYISNEGIDERNEAIKELADDNRIFYLDINEVVCDESGGMNPQYTSDGVHLKVKYIPVWREYLLKHAVVMQ